jgi:hypothetical protein
MHASTVGLIRNLQMGSITSQYHVVYDDHFTTVHATEEREPDELNDLVVFNRFQNILDEDADPELRDEWLNEKELQQRKVERKKVRTEVEVQQKPTVPFELPTTTI